MKRTLAAALLAAHAAGANAEDSPFRQLPPPDVERERAIEASKSYAIPALEIVGFDALLNVYDRHHFGCCDFDSNIHTIRTNLHSSWVTDRDPFLVNQLGHPYQGSMYHGFARSAGLNYWEGLGYTFLASAMWEIAGESTPPSRNDQINTGIGGSFLGEALFRMASLVLDHPGDAPQWAREVGAALISPPVGFNRVAFGDRFRTAFPSHDPIYFIRAQVGFSGTPRNEETVATPNLKRNEALADFLIDYGLPGKPDYEYTRPFDYFSFQATASSANGFENAFTRGLLVGRSYDVGSRYHGVWGLYGNYDYIAPQTYRVSATGLSLGTTGQFWIDDTWKIVSTVSAGVGYTAAGATGGVGNPAVDNDYHYGVAPQALAVMRLVYGDRAALDLAGREYYVSRVAGADRGGHVNVARLEAALTWRLTGHHAVSVRYLMNRRDATFPGVGDASQHRATVGIFYTYLGHDLFGAEKK